MDTALVHIRAVPPGNRLGRRSLRAASRAEQSGADRLGDPTGSVVKAHAHPALSLATVVLAAMLWTPLASAAAALRAQVSSCIPVADEDPATGVRGLTAAQRGVQLQYGWVTRSAADDGDKAGALAATTRLEICRFGADGNFICPASADVIRTSTG
jgi:hypothetical protein